MARYRLTKGTHSGWVDGERVEYVAGSKGHDIMELTDEQAKLPHFRKRIERLHELDFTPDDDSVSEISIPHLLAQNSDKVLAYIDQHADDEELLIDIQKAESNGKRRKTVLEKLDELLGE